MDPNRERELKPGKGSIFKELVKICSAKEKDLQCIKAIRNKVANHYKTKNNKSKTNYDDGKEHDPEEFMRALFDAMNDEFEEKHNWVKTLTEFVILEEHTCPNCKFKKEVEIEENIFQVSVKQESIEEGIKDKLKTETIEKGSGFKHKCPNPTNIVIVKKSLSVTPQMLLIQVNRFELEPALNKFRKTRTNVKLSHNITLNEFSHTLESSINHEGNSMETGHCIANVFEPKTGLFHRCSDSIVTKNLSGVRAKANQVYLATYSRR